MHCFVRDLSGRSLQFEASTVSSLQTSLAQRTSVPITEQRLTYGSHQLLPSEALVDAGVPENGTIHLSLRLRGGAPKKRCGFYLDAGKTDRCSQAAVRIVGDCQLCKASFCARHRLAEDHTCPNLESCKEKAFQLNKTKLESEQTISEKVARV
ncbi:hypothetical protein JCM8547_007306 [Rhodosporidiobolus lusitaniae]